MPLALDPEQTLKIILDSDKDKEASVQPLFVYRYLTGRQWREVGRTRDTLESAKNADEVADKVYLIASTGLVGWENMVDPTNGKPIEFDTDRLEDIIGLHEAQELIVKILQQSPTMEDKKKLESQSDCSTEQSATNVEDKPSAPTSQVPPSQ